MTKKATVPYMKQWLPDGHDSQEIPEEKTGITGLDIGERPSIHHKCAVGAYTPPFTV